jgi:hypothetical protein
MRWPIATATRETAVTDGYTRYRPRLAILGSPGLAYLRGRICAASIRQGFDVDLFPTSCAEYGYMLADRSSGLSRFLPIVVLLAAAADYPSAPQGSGRSSALARWAEQQLGVVLICSVILPVLVSLCGLEASRSNAPLCSMLEVIERQLCHFREREGVKLSFAESAQPELLIQWDLLPMWLRRKPQSNLVLLNLGPVGRTFAALFGLEYFCVVVDVNHHPWMVDRDIASFLLLWDKTQSSSKKSGGRRRGPDSFLFVDYDPLVTASQRLRDPLERAARD